MEFLHNVHFENKEFEDKDHYVANLLHRMHGTYAAKDLLLELVEGDAVPGLHLPHLRLGPLVRDQLILIVVYDAVLRLHHPILLLHLQINKSQKEKYYLQH